jgi:hypothetical protein
MTSLGLGASLSYITFVLQTLHLGTSSESSESYNVETENKTVIFFHNMFQVNKLTLFERVLGADYMDRASPVNRAEKCHENLPWAAK